jgi:DNA polymerase-3 subunit gamma/tau
MIRPITFSEVYGQDKIVEILKKIAVSPKTSVRAISLIGPTGIGKTTLMRLFAKALNCVSFHSDSQDIHVRDVCNVCLSCLDTMLYYEEDIATLLTLETTVAFLDKLKAEAPEHQKRLVVFEEVQLAPTASLDALLRSIEEGIPNTIIAFNSTKLLPSTLQSRCTTLKLSLIPDELISWRIEEEAKTLGLGIHPYHVMVLTGLARGRMREALNLLEQYRLGGIEGIRSPYLSLIQLILNKTKHLSNKEILADLLTYNPKDVVDSLKLIITNSYKEAGSVETALYTSGLVEILYNFVYNPIHYQAAQSKEGFEVFLHKLDKL